MMKSEFEKIAGYEVSIEDYNNIIEPMYMATNLTKDEFVKTISKNRFALKPIKSIVDDMKECAESLKGSCNHYTDYETIEKLESLIAEYIDRKGWKLTANYYIESQETPSKCSYPATIDIYGKKDYKTIEIIELVA